MLATDLQALKVAMIEVGLNQLDDQRSFARRIAKWPGLNTLLGLNDNQRFEAMRQLTELKKAGKKFKGYDNAGFQIFE